MENRISIDVAEEAHCGGARRAAYRMARALGFSEAAARLAPGESLILLTDGIRSGLDLSRYDRTVLGSPQRLAKAILRDWGREHDDVGVLVFRHTGR